MSADIELQQYATLETSTKNNEQNIYDIPQELLKNVITAAADNRSVSSTNGNVSADRPQYTVPLLKRPKRWMVLFFMFFVIIMVLQNFIVISLLVASPAGRRSENGERKHSDKNLLLLMDEFQNTSLINNTELISSKQLDDPLSQTLLTLTNSTKEAVDTLTNLTRNSDELLESHMNVTAGTDRLVVKSVNTIINMTQGNKQLVIDKINAVLSALEILSDADTAHQANILSSLQKLKRLNKTLNTLESASIENRKGITSSVQKLESVNETLNTLSVENKNGITTSVEKLESVTNAVSNLEDAIETIEGKVNKIIAETEKLTISSIYKRPLSCQDIRNKKSNSPTGYYYINGRLVYCKMGNVCGSNGGWTRLAYLDMSDPTVKCPSGLAQWNPSAGVRACGRYISYYSSSGSCASVKFPTNGISYSEVCGRVVGYQYGSPDAVTPVNNIESFYVDGVSITRGYPRKHVWTLMAGVSETQQLYGSNCPCSNSGSQGQTVPSFVGDHYYCESGNPSTWNSLSPQWFPSDPLWDRQGCESLDKPCCSSSDLPWFHRTFSDSTDDYLELRTCGNEATSNENVAVSEYIIFVK